VPGFDHNITVVSALIAAIIFGLVNAILGPILRLLTFPITLLTFGLFSIVVNYLLFVITVWIAPGFKHTPEISPWLSDLYGAIIMMIISTVGHAVTRQEESTAVR